MEKLPSQITGLVPELVYTRDSSGMHMASLQGHLPKWLAGSSLNAAVREIELLAVGKAKGVMVNRLDSGVVVPIHTDPATGWRRYHLPLQTNDDVWWWDAENDYVYMTPGFWWGPVPFTVPHQVGNNGNIQRVHLVIDL